MEAGDVGDEEEECQSSAAVRRDMRGVVRGSVTTASSLLSSVLLITGRTDDCTGT